MGAEKNKTRWGCLRLTRERGPARDAAAGEAIRALKRGEEQRGKDGSRELCRLALFHAPLAMPFLSFIMWRGSRLWGKFFSHVRLWSQ